MQSRLGWLIVVAVVAVAVQARPALALAPEATDLWLATAAEAVFERAGRLDPWRLTVTCERGIVRLAGAVITQQERTLAEALAAEVRGVRGVRNDIIVVPAVDLDQVLAAEVRAALIDSPLVAVDALRVDARRGVVTLHGIARRPGDRDRAERLAAELPRVQRVVNAIEMLPDRRPG
jgi:osmotically-inducible protein OsmY